MRQCTGGQAQLPRRRLLDGCRQSVGAADNEARADTFAHPGCQHPRHITSCEQRAAFIKHHAFCVFGNGRIDARRFAVEYAVDRLADAVFRPQLQQFDTSFRWHAFAVFLEAGLHPGRHFVA